ncbi:MAG: protein glxC [Solirubrobacterales bacterium]|nr:protein glxC [Solirubrobacterales bacterium]
MSSVIGQEQVVDLATGTVRALNAALHEAAVPGRWVVRNPGGAHNVAVGIDGAHDVVVDGHAGYYCAGMNQHATVRVRGSAGVGVAENMMSGTVVVEGNASQSAGATARGGLLRIDGDASARCAISLKGADVVVRGSVGHLSAFMAQRGRLLVCGDAGDALGDSLYEAHLYVAGTVAGLGADCIEKEVCEEHLAEIEELLAAASITDMDPRAFRRYGSARELYAFKVDDAGSYR